MSGLIPTFLSVHNKPGKASDNHYQSENRRIPMTNPHKSLKIARPSQNPHTPPENGEPHLPQPRETSISSQLGLPHTPIISAYEFQIVGIPPFPHHTKEARPDGTHPLPAPTAKKQAYLPVGAATQIEYSGTQILNRWKIAVFKSHGKRGPQHRTPPSSHNHKETGISSSWGRNGDTS